MKITDIFPLTQEQLNNPIDFGRFFLDQLISSPGKKLGLIGQPQSGSSTVMHYISGSSDLNQTGKTIFTYYEPRGIADTFKSTLPSFEDLNQIVRAQLPTWMPLIDKCPISPEITVAAGSNISEEVDPNVVQEMVAKISQDVEESRKMLLWRSAFSLFCLRDLRGVNANVDPTTWSIFELPYFPVNYSNYFDTMILLQRRNNWFNDPAFLAHIAREGVSQIAEENLVSMRDAEIADYQQAGNWAFDYTIVNDGTIAELETKVLSTLTDILGTN